jgi:NADP-dependent 3-hydroxy acid dehydrogenase YdfG
MKKLQGKIAVISGATSGIGLLDLSNYVAHQ